MPWTQFWDMHSGGGQKEKWSQIYIEAPEAEARAIFFNRFGHGADRITCTCCGEDYAVHEHETLEEASAYQRRCRSIEDERGWQYRGKDARPGRYLEPGEAIPDGYKPSGFSYNGEGRTLAEYRKDADVLIVPASEIKPEERTAEIPQQGWVWAG